MSQNYLDLSTSERIAYSTIRIECRRHDGSQMTGTGFFFKFKEVGTSFIPVIITNKHVISGAATASLLFTEADENGQPIDTSHYKIDIPHIEKNCIRHPDSDVDLCAIPFGNFVGPEKGERLFIVYFDKTLIPTRDQLEDLSALESVIMVGYPNGLWDDVNNKPIMRKGITATHPRLDYRGKKNFMIDAACFPGSSGSPVLIFNNGSFRNRQGTTFSGVERVILLGVLFAGPQHTVQGDIRFVEIPTVQTPTAISRIPNHLGVVIKSERIIELEELFN